MVKNILRIFRVSTQSLHVSLFSPLCRLYIIQIYPANTNSNNTAWRHSCALRNQHKEQIDFVPCCPCCEFAA